jgi:anti-sigma factor RsiW
MNPQQQPVTEAELHAYVDAQLTPERRQDVEDWLATRPLEAQRVERYRLQKLALRAAFDPVLAEPVPPHLQQAAQLRAGWSTQRVAASLAAGVAIALIGGAAGWGLRGALAPNGQTAATAIASAPSAFAQRAAVAHAVYSPDLRRSVEIDAAHEEQLSTWLSRRMGAPMKPPHLQAVGYSLEGGRLLPGGRGPVAQFMYRAESGAKLTLYVSNDVADIGGAASGASRGDGSATATTAFRFAQQGAVNVFYWVDGPFGYALSAEADRATLARVSDEVYRQIGSAPR